MGPKGRRSSVLTREEEVAIVAGNQLDRQFDLMQPDVTDTTYIKTYKV